MSHRWLQFAGFCFVFMGIVLFCVVLGGYTSFWRSQNRIEASKSLLTDACQKRLALLPGLIEMARKSEQQMFISEINQTAQKADKILKWVISQNMPLEKELIKEFEFSQSKLTVQLKEVFSQLETMPDKNFSRQFSDMKNLFFSAQDNLFVARKRYNDEATYFNTRKGAFWTSFIAKLFGFDKMEYIEISKDLFLPSKITFAKNSI